MGIDHIACLIIQVMDRPCCLLLTCIITIKVSKLCFHLFCNSIPAILPQFTHQLSVLIRIISGDPVDEAFQIAGYQNIHGR